MVLLGVELGQPLLEVGHLLQAGADHTGRIQRIGGTQVKVVRALLLTS